mmetsp:Transcript_80/g.129  ORF Transcript_80/g.129 Transcript_80/m.129 type:complete len:120 (+) Transcript_80:110-469(+)
MKSVTYQGHHDMHVIISLAAAVTCASLSERQALAKSVKRSLKGKIASKINWLSLSSVLFLFDRDPSAMFPICLWDLTLKQNESTTCKPARRTLQNLRSFRQNEVHASKSSVMVILFNST